MQYPGYNTGNVQLVEGKEYPFKIHNLVQLQDGADYYVLIDVNGMKHFMPYVYYIEYGFNIGDEINCKIDRINCTGRIFLEPIHPFYNETETYEFDLERYLIQDKKTILFVKGIIGSSIEVRVRNIDIDRLAAIKKVCCKVQNIKKGKITLELCEKNV